MKNFNIKIGGSAGEGIKSSGLILARALMRLGYSVYGYSEYPSLIRGGHNTYQMHAGVEPVFSQAKKVDILIALNQETITLHQGELDKDSLVLYDPGDFVLPEGKLVGNYLPIEFIKIAESAGGTKIMSNMVSAGVVMALLGLPLQSLKDAISKVFAHKPAEVALSNHKVAEAGEKYVADNLTKYIKKVELPKSKKKQMLITGNEAFAIGAIAGGLQFYSSYPMTPASSILHYLAGVAKRANIFVKHAEDEISSINMAIGAGYTGLRSMAATSGGGLCLMAEAIALSGVNETPLVVVDSMRPGPGAGMPTWSGQGDLKFVLSIGNDEFPRIVLAPGDAKECFDLAKLALEWAEKYQTLVIMLLDKNISESDFTSVPFLSEHKNKRYGFTDKIKSDDPETMFKRYQLEKSGVSLRTLPGQPAGLHVCTSYEHDEFGFDTEEADMRVEMMSKRWRKMDGIKKEIIKPTVFGADKSKVGLISFGSTKGPVLEALKQLPQVKFMHLNFIWPFPVSQVKEFVDSVDKIICLEGNATGQLASLIKEQTGQVVESFLKFDGRPFYPEEIIKHLSK